MGLTFKRNDDLDKMFDSFAILPDDPTKPDAKPTDEKIEKTSKPDKSDKNK